MNLEIIGQAFNLTNRANYGNDFGNNISSPEPSLIPPDSSTPARLPSPALSGDNLAPASPSNHQPPQALQQGLRGLPSVDQKLGSPYKPLLA